MHGGGHRIELSMPHRSPTHFSPLRPTRPASSPSIAGPGCVGMDVGGRMGPKLKFRMLFIECLKPLQGHHPTWASGLLAIKALQRVLFDVVSNDVSPHWFFSKMAPDSHNCIPRARKLKMIIFGEREIEPQNFAVAAPC
jgi:hypothetical protein